MLPINEIFTSVSGEIGHVPQGSPMLFIRVAGCNLKCSYCDTPEAQNPEKSTKYTIENVVERIIHNPCHNILFTGGEPMLYAKDIQRVIQRVNSNVSKNIFNFFMETNGTILPTKELRRLCSFIFDFKIKDFSLMEIDPYNAKENDIVKFIVGTIDEADIAFDVIGSFREFSNATLAIGTYNRKEVNESKLFKALVRNGFTDVIINTQIHKLIDMR